MHQECNAEIHQRVSNVFNANTTNGSKEPKFSSTVKIIVLKCANVCFCAEEGDKIIFSIKHGHNL